MQNSDPSNPSVQRWVKTWPDALAFLGGLSVAWFLEWETGDLIWSLWLSSLIVGYTIILWTVTRSLREFAVNATRENPTEALGPKLLVGGMYLLGALFMLTFFTVHFGLFHFVHSVFLNSFFPITEIKNSWPELNTYLIVLERYWVFLPAAFIAERAAFDDPSKVKDDGAVTAEAIAKRKARNATNADMVAPYRNVVRMHLLIFFFAGASFAKLDNFIVYGVVFAVYFFPWRMLKKKKIENPSEAK